MADPTKTTRVFRSSLWRGFAVLWLVFVVVVTVDIVRKGFPRSGLIGLTWVAFFSALVWMLAWRPYVRYDDDVVEVRNPARTAVLPWNTITRIDAAESLRVHTKQRIVRSWAVVRSGAVANLVRSTRTPPADSYGPERAALQALARRSPVDYAVEVLRDVWETRRTSTNGTETVTWAMPELIALAVSVVLVVIGLVVGG